MGFRHDSLIQTIKNDPQVASLLKKAKKTPIPYENLKVEIQSFTTGAVKYRIGGNYDFERAISLMHKVQSFLDRLNTINSELARRDGYLAELEKKAEDYISSFDSIATLRPAEIRQSVISSILFPLSKKRWRIAELQKDIEQYGWNLKHTFNVLQGQSDLAKQVWWMRDPTHRSLPKKER